MEFVEKLDYLLVLVKNSVLEPAEDDKKIKPAFCWFYQNILLL
ncbi:hypothetical protein [Bartonella queenslandensis]|nr:hypothetical protein [Bartonella queenslandensis]